VAKIKNNIMENLMKRFNVTVNGRLYDVAVEESTNTAPMAAAPAPVMQAPAPVAAAPAPQAAPAAAPAPAPAAAPAPSGAGSGNKVESPMPGIILDIKVAVGDTVKVGDSLVILEAMKMENDIVSSFDGTVTGIAVTKAQTVNSGDVILTIG
jgi:glutaconyl-CoA decarboxylase